MPFPKQPALQPIQVDIDNGRREEREYLRQSEPADNGVAEWLADLGADAGPEHHRDSTKQSCHRGHQDRPETLDAGLIDRFSVVRPSFCSACKAKSTSM